MAVIYNVVMIKVDCKSTIDKLHQPTVESIAVEPFYRRVDAQAYVQAMHESMSWAEQMNLITYITPGTEIG